MGPVGTTRLILPGGGRPAASVACAVRRTPRLRWSQGCPVGRTRRAARLPVLAMILRSAWSDVPGSAGLVARAVRRALRELGAEGEGGRCTAAARLAGSTWTGPDEGSVLRPPGLISDHRQRHYGDDEDAACDPVCATPWLSLVVGKDDPGGVPSAQPAPERQ